MYRFWGRNNDASTQKFSREDDQILSLNYENLCDSDYLNRIFAGDTSAEHSDSQQQVNQQEMQPSSTQVESPWSLTPDLPEDILLLGDNAYLARHLLQKRLLNEMSSVIKFQDSLSTLVHRQVDVFDHVANLINSKCLSANQSKVLNHTSSSVVEDGKIPLRLFVTNCMLGTLRSMEKQSRSRMKEASLEPILSLVITTFFSLSTGSSKSDLNPAQKAALLPAITHYLRSILCNCLSRMGNSANSSNYNSKQREEYLRLSLCSAYGLLVMGMYTCDTGDILMAIAHLVLLDLQGQEWADQVSAEPMHLLSSASPVQGDPISLEREKEREHSQKRLRFKTKGSEASGSGLNLKIVGNPSTLGNNYNNNNGGDILISNNISSGKLDDLVDLCDDPCMREASQNHDDHATNNFIAGKSWNRGTTKGAMEKMDKEYPKMKMQIVKNRSVVLRSACLVTKPVSTPKDKDLRGMDLLNDHPTNLSSKHLPFKTSVEEGIVNLKQLHVKGHHNASITTGAGPHHNNQQNQQQNQNSHHQHQHHNHANHTGVPANKKKVPGGNLSPNLHAHAMGLQNLLKVPKGVVKILRDKLFDFSSLAASASMNMYPSCSSRKVLMGSASGRFGSDEVPVKSYVWSCGQNSYGELGHSDVNQRRAFAKVAFFEGMFVTSVGAGNEHSAFVTREGKLFVAGYNDNGQCGTGSNQQVRQLTAVAALEHEEVAEVHVYNGCEHTLVTSREGKLYSFGYNYRGQLGHGSTSSESSPRPIKSLLSRRVVMAASSYHHSIILCSDGSLFSCGRNDCGQLGHGDQVDKKTPHQVTAAPKDIRSISCGQFHSIMASGDGQAYVCGKNDYGQLGLESPDNVKTPTHVKCGTLDEDEGVLQVCCGYYHTLLLLHNGTVLGFGRNDYGQLGLGHTQPKVNGCQIIGGLNDKNVTAIAAGCYHSLAITSNGMLYVFGRNNHGQLGTGDLEERHLPHPVDNFVGKRIASVAAGFYHTIVLVTDASGDDDLDLDVGLTPLQRTQRRLSASGTLGIAALSATGSASTSSLASSSSKKSSSQGKIANLELPEQKGDDDVAIDFDSVLASIMEHNSPSGAGITPSSPRKVPAKQGTTAPFKGFNLDARSKISIKEIIVVMIRQLDALISKSSQIKRTGTGSFTVTSLTLTLGKDNKDSKENGTPRDSSVTGGMEMSWLVRLLGALAVLIDITRTSATASRDMPDKESSGNSTARKTLLPLSRLDALGLLKTLLKLTETLLKQNSATLLRAHTSHSDSSDNDTDTKSKSPQDEEDSIDFGLSLDDPTMATADCSTRNLVEKLSEIHSLATNLFDHDAEGNEGSVGIKESDAANRRDEAKVVGRALGALRKEIIFTYLFLSPAGQGGAGNAANQPLLGAVDEVAQDACSCITGCFEVMFPTQAQRSQLFVFLGRALAGEGGGGDVLHSHTEMRSGSSALARAESGGVVAESNSMIAPNITAARAVEVNSSSGRYEKCLRLFTRLCLKYREISSVLKLFQASNYHGLVVLDQLLNVFNHLSMMGLAPVNKAQQSHSNLRAGDVFRAAGTLEHCCSNFVKCAMPIIFESFASTTEPYGSVETDDVDFLSSSASSTCTIPAFGMSIIRHVFETAEAVLDFLSHQRLTDPTASVFRHGTVIPSILPTILLYGVSFSKRCPFALHMLPLVRSLTTKLYAVANQKTEVPIVSTEPIMPQPLNKAPAPVEKRAQVGSSHVRGLLHVVGGIVTAVGGSMTSHTGSLVAEDSADKLDAQSLASSNSSVSSSASSGVIVDSLAVKKLALQVSWWSRLLKISTILSAKLAACLLYDPVFHAHRLRAIAYSCAGSSDSAARATAMNAIWNANKFLASHSLWRFATVPNDLNFRRNSLSDELTTDAPTMLHNVQFTYKDVAQTCEVLRTNEMKTNHMYRVLFATSKASKAVLIHGFNAQSCLERLEALIFDAIVHVEGLSVAKLLMSSVGSARSAVGTIWKGISDLTKKLHSKRSDLMAEAGHDSWTQVLYTLTAIVSSVHSLLTSCLPRLAEGIPLLSKTFAPQLGASRAKRMFRRAVCTIICAHRWKALVRMRVARSPATIVDFFAIALDHVTSSFTAPSAESVSARWRSLVDIVLLGCEDVERFAHGVMAFVDLLKDTNFVSMKADVMIAMCAAWKDRMAKESKPLVSNIPLVVSPSSLSSGGDMAICSAGPTNGTCRAHAVEVDLKRGLVSLLQQVNSITQDFLLAHKGASSAGSSELSLLTLSTKFMHMGFSQDLPSITTDGLSLYELCLQSVCGAEWNTFLHQIRQAILMLDDRVTDTGSVEEKQPRSKSNPRERSKMLRRASNSLIYLLQGLAMRETRNPSDSRPHICNQLISLHCDLFAHFQRARISQARNNLDIESVNGFKGGLDGAGAAAGGTTKSGKDSSKRRCQDLITKPVEFSRTQEGFVVQGDKLLNNFKGTDFTLATWIYLSKKSASKQSFITGKVSHNDAWPLVIVKADGKVSVMFGHGNEFETMISQAALPSMVWTHIAVVVEAKKVKLFINGNQDCQVVTKGNTRAILYPVVVGTCPQGVRTRVDQVREGFDGMLAQYKYYTRGLSPIHVRVVFDQGPPESYDVRERWMFQLLTSFRPLLEQWEDAVNCAPSSSLACNVGALVSVDVSPLVRAAEVLHMLFVTDSGSRLRIGSLRLLEKILETDLLNDLSMSAHTGYILSGALTCTGISSSFGSHVEMSILTCPFLSEHASFHERLCLYFIRLVGAAWAPAMWSVTEDMMLSDSSSPTADFVTLLSQHIRQPPKQPQLQQQNQHQNQNQQHSQDVEMEAEMRTLRDFLNYVPGLLSLKNLRSSASPFSAPASAGSSMDSQGGREEQVGELFYHVIVLLRNLSSHPVWGKAIANVVASILQKAREVIDGGLVSEGAEKGGGAASGAASMRNRVIARKNGMGREDSGAWSVSSSIDSLGAVVLLGEKVAGPFVGTDVISFFGDRPARVLNVHKNNSHITLLASKVSGTRSQLSVVRVSDVVANTMPCSMKFDASLVPFVLDLMESLRGHVQLLSTDLLCIHRPDHAFQRQSMLRVLRPMEALLFHQLLRFVISVKDDFDFSLIRARPALYQTIQQVSVHALSSPSSDASPQARDDAYADGALPSLWLRSARCVAALTGPVTVNEFPPPECERGLFDFVGKVLGVAVETFQRTAYEKFLLQGMFTELIYSVPSGSANVSSGDVPWVTQSQPRANPSPLQVVMGERGGQQFPMNDWIAAASEGASFALNVFGSTMGDHDTAAAGTLHALHLMRKSIIQGCRELVGGHLLKRDDFAALPLSSQILLWQSLVAHNSCNAITYWGLSSNLDSMEFQSPRFSPRPMTLPLPTLKKSVDDAAVTMVLEMCDVLSQHSQHDVTHTLASSLRFSAISLLQMTTTKSANILDSTNILNKLFAATNVWLQFHQGSDAECDLCHHILKMLLPSLSFVESSEVELQMMELCRAALQRLVQRVMAGHKPSKELLDLARSNNFTLLRARAQEQLVRQKGNARYQFTALAQNLTQLSCGLEIVQRLGQSGPGKFSWSAINAVATLSVQTARPAIVGVRQSSVDADLIPCAMAVVAASNEAQEAGGGGSRRPSFGMSPRGGVSPRAPGHVPPLSSSSATAAAAAAVASSSMESYFSFSSHHRNPQNGSPFNSSMMDGILVEVAIGVVVEGEECVYETVYSGSSLRFVQSGLSPGCSYKIKCRASIVSPAGMYALDWCKPLEFHTDSGVGFAFDPLKCGSDILLSDDGLTASYAGDDCWSTLLATQSFSSGVTSWKIRITQSSTAYIFVGVAGGAADLNTFLGGCNNGWGFIGEQALYHNREKVKVYGEAFSAGDVIGAVLDLNHGTLSFSRNGKPLGVAFDKIYGELYPAVAFYNVGQELEIIGDGFHTTCPQEPIPCSPSRVNIDDISLLNEFIYCMNTRSPLSQRLLLLTAEHVNQWCGGAQVRCRTIAGKYLFLSKTSALLQRFGLIVGERVRTPYGVADVVGCAHNRVWFMMGTSGNVWFFSNHQIVKGREKGFFMRCSYEIAATQEPKGIEHRDLESVSMNTLSSYSRSSSAKSNATVTISGNSLDTADSVASVKQLYDLTSLQEMLDPERWSYDMDCVLVAFLIARAQEKNVSPWCVPSSVVSDEFRQLQQQLSRIVMANVDLVHRWGIAGPKRRAVVARLGLLRMLNHMIDFNLPALLMDTTPECLALTYSGAPADEFAPNVCTIKPVEGEVNSSTSNIVLLSDTKVRLSNTDTILSVCGGTTSVVPSRQSSQGLHGGKQLRVALISLSWEPLPASRCLSQGALAMSRNRLFTDLKNNHFWEVLARSSERPAKTDDDYDYPEDLPQVKINRFKSFRAREAAELLGMSGEDLMHSSMFYQLWREMRKHGVEKMRMTYTHPMDDGQSRAFKIRFDGEGVDDYGGPYREIFQQICEELQRPDPASGWKDDDAEREQLFATAALPSEAATEKQSSEMLTKMRGQRGQDANGDLNPTRCFIPLLLPTANWVGGECEERYRFTFYPGPLSAMKLELYRFLGQMVGMAVRSRITLDLPLPSLIWKCVTRETLTESDIASFDASSAEFAKRLGALHSRIQRDCGEEGEEEQVKNYIQDLTWTATRCDGNLVELIPGGAKIPVEASDLGEYLRLYVTSRLLESAPAVEAFRGGFLSVIPENALALFSWQEIQRLVCGSAVIDVSRLKENTEYDDDVTAEDFHIVAFWEVLGEFSEAEKSAFLRFVWARPTLPPRDVEFPQKFKIQSAVGDDATLKPDQYLPKAHTCFFSVNLPRYSSKQLMAEKLRYAIANCTEMDADYKLTDTDVAGWGSILAQS